MLGVSPGTSCLMAKLSRRDKILAVARLEAGERITSVAKDLGIRRASLSRWRDVLVAARPDKFPNLARQLSGDSPYEAEAEEAGDIAERLKKKEEKVLELIMDRLVDLIPAEARAKDLLVGMGILLDKRLVQQGKPTQIYGNAHTLPEDASPVQLEQLAEELRRRRLKQPTPTPEVIHSAD